MNVHPYRGLRIGLLTQHGKERLLAPLAQARLGAELVRIEGFDTDRLGTFTRTVERAGSQLEAAERKARLATQLSDLRLVLGSEGAFTVDPQIGLIPWGIELLVLYDRDTDRSVIGRAEGPETNCRQAWCRDWAEVEAFARAVGFPAHGLILSEARLEPPIRCQWRGGLDTWTALQQAWRALATPAGAWLETEMRAHLNPTRQAMIVRAGEDLFTRLVALCPACGAVGFGRTRALPGRPCAACDWPTPLPWIHRSTCAVCGFERDEPIDARADPAECPRCNP